MPSIEKRNWRRWVLASAGMVLAGAVSVSLAYWMEEKHLMVFTSHSSFTVGLAERESKLYVDLNDLLERTGSVVVAPEKNAVKLRLDGVEAYLETGKESAIVGNTSLELGGKALVENGRALVPVASLSRLLAALLKMPADYHPASQRLFLGDAGSRFALELRKSDVTQLVVTFAVPVSPQISTEPGKLRMIFKRDPIAMASQNWHFDDPVITSASYSEGVEPELTIAGNQPLLATFADEGRTITVMPAPALAPPPTTGSSALPSPEPAQSTATSVAVPAPASIPTSSGGSPAAREHYLIVLDASHGGDEPGAALSQKLAEKDVTLTIARRVRTQLQERGLATLMVRDADATLPLDDRAALANTSQAAVYIAIHAGGLGQGVHVYTSLLAPADPAIFVPWDQAQAAFVRSSRILASAVNDELGKNRLRAPLALQPAPLRPLNNITAAAIAVEVGPPGEPIETLNNSDYQDSVAKALAAALVTVRPRIEASR